MRRAPFAAAVKVNVAFFERWGSDGVRALERLRGRIPADLPFIADAKRGDIGSTAAQYAVALYDVLGADAVTASPYLGSEAIAPLLDRADRLVYLLCRTSNPGALELQGLEVAADPASGAPAEAAGPAGGAPGQRVGTSSRAPSAWWSAPPRPTRWPWYVPSHPDCRSWCPGSGPRAATWTRPSRHGPAATGAAAATRAGALLVNVSRGISGAAIDASDPAAAIEAAARSWATRLGVLG